jgi:Domain of unknown function (DUF5063)
MALLMTPRMPDSADMPADPVFGAFVLQAQRWCTLMESGGQMTPDDWLQHVHGRLVALYAVASRLPHGTTPGDTDDGEETSRRVRAPSYTPLSANARHDLCRSIAARLGPLDAYSDLADDAQGDSTVIPCSLAYDLSGITQDLRAGLYTWESEGHDAGRWHARFFFEHSWSRHLSGALRALEAHARAGRTAWPAGTHDDAPPSPDA